MGIKIDVDRSYTFSLGHKTTKVSIRSVDILYISQDYLMRILEALSSTRKVWSNRRQTYTRCFSGTYNENGRPWKYRTHEHGIMSGSMGVVGSQTELLSSADDALNCAGQENSWREGNVPGDARLTSS